jgi:hypothetical protein
MIDGHFTGVRYMRTDEESIKHKRLMDEYIREKLGKKRLQQEGEGACVCEYIHMPCVHVYPLCVCVSFVCMRMPVKLICILYACLCAHAGCAIRPASATALRRFLCI